VNLEVQSKPVVVLLSKREVHKMAVELDTMNTNQVLVKNVCEADPDHLVEKLWNLNLGFFQKQLYEAFKSRNGKRFDRLLENGANPEQVFDGDSNLSLFEMLCQTSDAGYYILKCLDFKADPNRVSIVLGY
jgi:hypothetical protein